MIWFVIGLVVGLIGGWFAGRVNDWGRVAAGVWDGIKQLVSKWFV